MSYPSFTLMLIHSWSLNVQVSSSCFISGDLQWRGAGLVGKGSDTEAGGNTQLHCHHGNMNSNIIHETFMFNMYIIFNDLIRFMVKLHFQFIFLQVKERPDVGVYIKDLIGYVVNNADDMDKIMMVGHKNSKQTTK